MDDKQKVKNFRLTLDHHAREWYDKADCKTSWKKMKLEFSRYFSTQGRSMKNLLNRWKEFKFNPQTDDIEEFVRDAQETVVQLKYGQNFQGPMRRDWQPSQGGRGRGHGRGGRGRDQGRIQKYNSTNQKDPKHTMRQMMDFLFDQF